MEELNRLKAEKLNMESSLQSIKFEVKSLYHRAGNVQKEMTELQNLRHKKTEALQRLPNGHDAVKGMEWLKDNKDQVSFFFSC